MNHQNALAGRDVIDDLVLSNVHYCSLILMNCGALCPFSKIISVNGHLIVTDTMPNLDLLQNNEMQQVTLEVQAGVNARQLTLEEVDMGAEETVDECINRANQDTNHGQETEGCAPNAVPSEMQVEEVCRKGCSILIIILRSSEIVIKQTFIAIEYIAISKLIALEIELILGMHMCFVTSYESN
jgi:hypothetical protein